MDIYLNREAINYAKEVLNTNVAQEETMEMIVPDALPDISRVVSTEVNVYIRAKDTDNGRITLTGIAVVTVLYCPDGLWGVRKMNADIPFSISAAHGDITPNSSVVANIHAASADTSVLNPRKVVIRIGLVAGIMCYNDASAEYYPDMPNTEDAEIELYTESYEANMISNVVEKMFTISDEMILPPSNPPIGEILQSKAALTVDDTKTVGNKLIIKGTANVRLLYAEPENGAVSGAESAVEYSQILEIDGINENTAFEIMPMLTSAYFDADPDMAQTEGRRIIVEIHAVAQCITIEKKEMPMVRDLYSTKYDLETAREPVVLPVRCRSHKTESAVRGFLDTSEEAVRVIAVNAQASGAATEAAGDGLLRLTCPVSVTALCAGEDGRILPVSGRLEVSENIEVSDNCGYTVAVTCEGEVHASAASGGIDVCVPIVITVSERAFAEFDQIYGVSYDEDAPLDLSGKPSIIISRPATADNLWQLAKRHHSTPSLILQANGLESEDEMSAEEMLIIPLKKH